MITTIIQASALVLFIQASVLIIFVGVLFGLWAAFVIDIIKERRFNKRWREYKLRQWYGKN